MKLLDIKNLNISNLYYIKEPIDILPLRGNQWIPLGIKTTIKERVRICSKFDEYCNGGSICHINIDKPIENEKAAYDLLNYITDQGVTYFALNGKLSSDDNGHLFYGEYCPQCGSRKTSEFTRTVGFYTKIASWSEERKEEFKLRDWHQLNDKGLNA